MISRNLLAVFLLTMGMLSSVPAAALDSSSPIGIAIVPPLQFPNTNFAIKGIRLGILGVNREARGLDLAILGNVTKQTFKGVAIAGLFNYNRVSSDIIGLQLAGLANINGTSSRLYGIQIAAYNKVSKVYGIQLGIINVAQELHGIQIGLINFNASGPFKASPIINVAF